MAIEGLPDIIATYSARFDEGVATDPAGSETFVAGRRALREKYGDRLGDGLFLALNAPLMIEDEGDLDTLYGVLAQEITNRLGGTHEDRVIAASAMLEMHRRIIQAMYNRH